MSAELNSFEPTTSLSSVSSLPAFSRLNLAQAVAAYLPENLTAQLAANLTSLQAATNHQAQPHLLNAVTMMVDITGFTPLCEALAKKGREGAEQVSTLINLFFAEALRPVQEQGGVIAKFGGDAFVAFFEQQVGESWAATGRRALQSALSLQKLVAKYHELKLPRDTSGQTFQLYAKVGLAGGTLLAFGVGLPAQHCDYQFVGAPLNEAAEAEHQAKRGEIILHANLLAKLATLQPELELGDERQGTFPLRNFATTILPLPLPQPLFDLSRLSSAELETFLAQAAAYIPTTVYERLKLGYLRLPGEHRRVVSLFVNFSGFNWLSDEQAPAKFDRYYLAVWEVVKRHGGYLNRISSGDKGDLCHILFGAPITHRDDEERALRCALELQATARQFEYITGQKIGLSSGFVFAGDIGSPNRHEYTIMGDSVNLSARLMQLAGEWQILADVSTTKRAGTSDRFEFGAARTVQLKGKSLFVDVVEVVGARETAAIVRRSTAQPIYGREQELAAAHSLLLQSFGGQTTTLAVAGEAGIGKSYFLERVVTSWQSIGGKVGAVRLANVDYERRAFGVWARWLLELTGLEAKASAGEKEEQLRQFIGGLVPELVEWLPLWGELVGLELPEASWLASLERGTRRQKLVEYTREWLSVYCRQQPLLLFCDDFHWADSASVELLDGILGGMSSEVPLLVCVSYRTGQAPASKFLETAQGESRELVLPALPSEAGREFVLNLLGSPADLPEQTVGESEEADFIEGVLAQSNGNPLFIEELLSSWQRGQAAKKSSAEAGDEPASAGEKELLPINLHTVIMDRLDGLAGNLRETVLAAAVAGSGFTEDLVRRLLPSAGEAGSSAGLLKQLHQLDLILPEERGAKQSYRFRHALIQQVAYESLPFSWRRGLHEAVGAWLEEQAADAGNSEENLERLAYHYEQSENDDKAILYLRQSAEKAAKLFANAEAITLYERALARENGEVAATVQPEVRRVELLRALGDVHSHVSNFQAAIDNFQAALNLLPDAALLECAELYQRIADVLFRLTKLAEALETVGQGQACLEGLKVTRANRLKIILLRARLMDTESNILRDQSNFKLGLEVAEQGLALLEKISRPNREVIKAKIKLYQTLARNAIIADQSKYAQQALAKAVKLSRRLDDIVIESQILYQQARLSMQMGWHKKAIFYYQKVLEIFEKIGTTDQLALTCIFGGYNFFRSGNFKQARIWVIRGLELSKQLNIIYNLYYGYYYLGNVEMADGNWLKAQDYFLQALAITKEAGMYSQFVYYSIYCCEFLGKAGQPELAKELATEALVRIEKYELSKPFNIYYWITLVEFYNNLGEFAQAAECFKKLPLREIAEQIEPDETRIFVLLHWAEFWALQTLAQADSTFVKPNVPESRESGLRAQAYVQRSLACFQKNKSFIYIPITYRIAGLVEWVRGEPEQALKYFTFGLKQARRMGHQYLIACLLQCRGLLHREMGNQLAAQRDRKKAGAIFNRLPARPDLQFLIVKHNLC